MLDAYKALLGPEKTDRLFQTAKALKRAKVVHVNSTKEGGGVAEILAKMVPLMNSLGLDAEWHTIQGEASFFQCTKLFHNLLQGSKDTQPSPSLLQTYEQTNQKNAAALQDVLEDADIVFIHDPQPLALLAYMPQRKGKWIWRCHIDLSTPSDAIWTYLKPYVDLYDATIFSMKEFAKPLSHPTYIIPPSIDPFSQKNCDLEMQEIHATLSGLRIDHSRPYLLQVSRFDRLKDPLGVIETYRLIQGRHPELQLVLVGGGASDDPEGEQVLKETKERAEGDPNIHILVLPSDSHRSINALQRGAKIVLQKSLKEGFGLTVAEALWKRKPVIGGNAGGIRLQIIDGETGFLVSSPQEAAERIEDFLQNPPLAQGCGVRGQELVKEKFLITRQLQDYLNVMTQLA